MVANVRRVSAVKAAGRIHKEACDCRGIGRQSKPSVVVSRSDALFCNSLPSRVMLCAAR